MDVLQTVKRISIATAALSLLATTCAIAQATSSSVLQATRAPGGVSPGVNTSIHSLPANTPAGATLRRDGVGKATNPTLPLPNGAPRYEGDLENNGGAVVTQGQHFAIYVTNAAVGCPVYQTACWGNPGTFLQNLAGSSFIHVVDQYTGRTDGNRYTLNPFTTYAYFTPTTPAAITDADIQLIVHLASTTFNLPTGYGSIFDVFLPPGMDECFDSALTVCYSPNIPSTFYFCAYHGSVDFYDIGHTLYTVEPFQNTYGCNVPPGTPNGQLIDSTVNVLSHETFETITDPDGGSGWVNIISNALYGEEIGDECSFLYFAPTAVYFNPSVFNIGGTKYAVQPEYSNIGHGCRTNMNN